MQQQESAIARAVSVAGGQSAMARELGLRPQAVQRWVATGTVPAVRVLDVERIAGGKVSRHELRPDIYPTD